MEHDTCGTNVHIGAFSCPPLYSRDLMASVVHVRDLEKHYRVHERAAGLGAALRSIFRRKYRTVRAVDGVSFEIAEGERVGFLGPNGAGKTTTLKVLSGLLHPTSGEVRVDGFTPRKREEAFLKRIMLVMGQKQQLLWDLPAAETFELNRAIYDVPLEQFRTTTSDLIEMLDIGDLVRKPVRQLSLGERMKCELVAALVHRPKVLFLDEPTIGLDVSMQVVVRDFIRDYNEKHGATLILTSHYMDDVAALCPRVIVIDKGKLSFDGSLESLVRAVRPEKRVRLRFASAVDEAQLREAFAVVSTDGSSAELRVDEKELAPTIARALSTLPVADLTVEAAPLEEVMSEVFDRTRKKRKSSVPASRAGAPSEPTS